MLSKKKKKGHEKEKKKFWASILDWRVCLNFLEIGFIFLPNSTKRSLKQCWARPGGNHQMLNYIELGPHYIIIFIQSPEIKKI